ncbi:hypothetical protein ACIPSE_43465 [Streptomyces sp. NPDC090106]|uniref:hypothetical protein n=1 Tax=Streptomyces sp. NPDC090106 TaxID=3365946 RepID=UPI00381EB5E4
MIDMHGNSSGPLGIARLCGIVGVMSVGLFLSVLAHIIAAIAWGTAVAPSSRVPRQGRAVPR